MLQNWYCKWWQPTRVTLDSSLELRFNAVVTLVRLKSRRANSYVKYSLTSAWMTSHIPQMSGQTPDVQLRAIDAVFLHYRTPHPTWASVPMFSFLLQLKYFSDILWMSNSARNGHSIFALSDNSRPTQPSVPMFHQVRTFDIQLRSDIRSDVHLDIHSDTHMPILHYPTIYRRPSTFPCPADSTHCHFLRSSPI